MKDVAKAGTKLAEAPVWLGGKSTVGLAPKTDLSLLIPAGAKDKVSAEAVFKGPLQAPIKQGQEVGKLVITVPGLDNANEIPLVATEDVKKGGFVVRVKAALARLSGKAFEAAMERVNS